MGPDGNDSRYKISDTLKFVLMPPRFENMVLYLNRPPLGSGLIETQKARIDRRKEVERELVVTCGNLSEVVEATKGRFDPPTIATAPLTKGGSVVLLDSWIDGYSAHRSERKVKAVGIVAVIGNQKAPLVD